MLKPKLLLFTSTVLIVLAAQPLEGREIEVRQTGSEDEIEIPQQVQWGPLLRQTLLFLGVQHSFRVATEPGTREGLKGPFFRDYARSVSALHGWSDEDPFYVNYLGHPMQGAVSGYIFVHNDGRYQTAEFGRNAHYWKSRLRAMAYSFAYSTQFEIGPLSEASIGAIQSRHPQQGFVDHVVTPTIGMGWMVVEDALDRKVIRAIEHRVENAWVRAVVRGALNPSRSFANAMRFKRPWHRDTRPGVLRFRPFPKSFYESEPRPFRDVDEAPPWSTVAPFEFAFNAEASSLGAGESAHRCVGGGGVAQVRLTGSLALLGDVGGCKLLDMEPNHSGDVLNFGVGPRWTYRGAGRWTPYTEILIGGRRVTLQEHDPAMKVKMKQPGYRELPAYEKYRRFATLVQATGLAITVGGGLDVGLHRALNLRLANLQYSRARLPGEHFSPFERGLRFSFGLWVRSGTW